MAVKTALSNGQSAADLAETAGISQADVMAESARTAGSGINPDALIGNIASNNAKVAPPVPGAGTTPAHTGGATGSLPGVVGSSQSVVNGENSLKSDISKLSVPSPSEQSARDASQAYMDEIDKQVSALEQRRKDEVANIEAQYADAKQQTADAQNRDRGTTNVALARVGGYLGTQISGVGVLNNMAVTQRNEMNALEAKKSAAVSAANNAITDKEFDLALKKREEIKSLDAEIDKRRNTFFDQTMTLLNANRDGFDKTITGLAASGKTPDDATFEALDKMNDYAPGVSKGAFNLAQEDTAAKKTKSDLENFNLLTDVVSKLRPDQQVTVNGKSYSGTMSENEFKGYEVNKSTGDIATVTYNKRTGATTVVNQKGVLTPNIDYTIQSTKNADGSTSLWYVDPTGKSPAVPVLGSQTGGAQQGINLGILQTAYPAGTKPAGTEHGWCLEFVNSLITNPYPAGSLNTIEQKKGAVDASITTPAVGDLIFTNEDATYGHVALINGLRTDPTTGKMVAILTESNYQTDGKGNGIVGHTRTIDVDPANLAASGGKILGYAHASLRPELGSQLTQLGDASPGGSSADFSNLDPQTQFVARQVAASKNLTKDQRAAVMDIATTDGIDGLKRWAYSNKLSVTQKTSFDAYDTAQSAFQSALAQATNLEAGPYKALMNEKAPYLAMKRDPAYTQLRDIIELGQAQIRKGFYGTAVTTSEAGYGNKFLISDADDMDTIKMKLDQGGNFLRFVNDATVARSIGLDKPDIFTYIGTPLIGPDGKVSIYPAGPDSPDIQEALKQGYKLK